MLYLSSYWTAGGYSNRVDQADRKAYKLPEIDIQKAIDYPRSDLDSDSKPVASQKNAAGNNPAAVVAHAEKKKSIVEQRIDEILAQGGLEVNSEGSILNQEQESQKPPDANYAPANLDIEEFSDNEAFGLDNINDKDDLFLSELGNILLEEEKFSDDWADRNEEDIQ